ncbi:MAG TPA: CHAD domain-containing protein [Gaiellales bacterium]
MKARPVKVNPRRSVASNAARILRVRLDELYGFDPAVRDPARVTELHDMRIAAKRLRYVLEITGHCFGDVGSEAEAVAKALQEVLGEIHDCDVLIPRVDQELATLRAHDALTMARLSPDVDDLPTAIRRAPGRARYRGLETLAAALTARRSLLHARFVAEWSEIMAGGLRERLL